MTPWTNFTEYLEPVAAHRALLKFVNYLVAVDTELAVILFTLDLSVTFYTVDHSIPNYSKDCTKMI